MEDDVPQSAFFKNFKSDVEAIKSGSKGDNTIIGIKEISERDDTPDWKPKGREWMIMVTMAISSLVVVSLSHRSSFPS